MFDEAICVNFTCIFFCFKNVLGIVYRLFKVGFLLGTSPLNPIPCDKSKHKFFETVFHMFCKNTLTAYKINLFFSK